MSAANLLDTDHPFRITFEKAQLKSTEERVEFLENATEKERATAERLQSTKEEIEEEIESLQSTIDRTHDKLAKAKLAIENASKDVDAARKTARDLQLELDRRHKDISELRDEIERLSVDRHAVYRKCRLEDIELPLLSGSLDEVPIEGTEKSDDDAMDVDSDETPRNKEPRDFGIEPDFSLLDDEDRTDNHVAHGIDYEARIVDLKAQIERLMPNMKARDRLKEVNDELDKTETDMEKARRHSRETRDRFLEIKRRRCDLFNKTFAHMSNCIDKIYKDLTKNRIVPTGGMAFLSLENADEPYLGGVKYNTMPPGKRFVEIDQLSGGEKTMAALALLFSIHSYHPSPFFVLDEVDAALDATNVSKLARYLLDQAHKNVQFLIISLKSSL